MRKIIRERASSEFDDLGFRLVANRTFENSALVIFDVRLKARKPHPASAVLAGGPLQKRFGFRQKLRLSHASLLILLILQGESAIGLSATGACGQSRYR
jgi:hypothetical protein